MTPDTNPATEPNAGPDRSADLAQKLPGALLRYRIMAFTAGIWLLLLCVEMFMRYLVNENQEHFLGKWVAQAHGWIYVIYLITVVDLWTRARTSTGQLISMVLAGAIPIFSFIQERRTTKQIQAILTSLRNR